jgi:murein DD-endopeptidase MepM/ murein hydrolase activator NlpD
MRRFSDFFEKSMRKSILIFLSLLLLFMTGMESIAAVKHHPVSNAKTREKRIEQRKRLRGKLSTLQSQIRKKRTQIRIVKRKERNAIASVTTVERRLMLTENRLSAARDRLSFLEREHRKLTRRIQRTEASLNARRDLLAVRIRQNYEQGNMNYAQVLFRSRSFNDYLSRSYYVQRIVESDEQLVQGIKADHVRLLADQKRLMEQETEQRNIKQTLGQLSSQYASDADQKRQLLHSIQQSRDELEQELDLLEQESSQIETMIRATEETPSGRARMLQPYHGFFIRPAEGPITSPFGMRFHPILHCYRMHTGVDIGARYGSPIIAAAAGVVIYASYMRGYGNTVILDHGGGLSTLYAHCSALLVRVGEHVLQGQEIARVGATGLATGPHLHFEIRRNGHPIKPYWR